MAAIGAARAARWWLLAILVPLLLSCAAPVPPPPIVAAVAPPMVNPARRDNGLIVPVFYATDRAHVPGAAPADRFQGRRGESLSYGIVNVSIPPAHDRGEIENPKWWRFEFRADPKKHIVLLPCAAQKDPVCGERDRAGFLDSLRARVSEDPRRDAFVFIHGYNVTFEGAIQRTAQIAYDLKFGGAAIAFSWPSAGTLAGYGEDEKTVRGSAAHLEQFLTDVARESGATRVHVMAHSMGNRSLLAALENLAKLGGDPRNSLLGQVMMAAPDVDAADFRKQTRALFPSTSGFQLAANVTLYASRKDAALRLSKQAHALLRAAGKTTGDFHRAGEADPIPAVVQPGIETIDVSGVDTDFVGHFYYADNETVLADVKRLILKGDPARKRPALHPASAPDGQYWRFAP